MLGLLLITLLFGSIVNGAKSWIGIGSFGVQPSEFAKIIVILFLASYLEDNNKELDNVKVFITTLGIVGIPGVLIILQPDLGTTMVFIPIFFTMLFLAGANIKYLLYLLITAGITVFLILFYAWNKYINPNTLNWGRIFVEKWLILIITGAWAVLSALSIFRAHTVS